MKKLTLIAFATALLSTSAMAQQSYMPIRSITVSGMAEKKVVPDEAHLQVNLNSTDMKMTTAKAAHDKKLAKLMDIVKSEGIDARKVRTESSTTQPLYDYVNAANGQSTRVFKGYRVQTNLDVTLEDTNKLGALMEKITAAGFEQGANTEWGNLLSVNYQLSKPDAVRDELLTAAIANARSKAERMAQAADASIARVYTVNEGNAPSFNFPPMPMMAMARMEKGGAADAAYAPPAGEQNVQASVTVTFELK